MSEINDILNNPDGALIRKENSEKITQKLMRHSVPLTFFKKGRSHEKLSNDDIVSTASGVLVQFDSEHFFILTAGHCVENFHVNDCAIGIDTAPHRYMANPSWDYNYEPFRKDGLEFGYIRVPPTDAKTFQANEKIFLNYLNLEIFTRDELLSQNDWIVLSGYPSMFLIREQKKMGTALLVSATTVEGKDNAPASTLKNPDSKFEYIDLWIPKDGIIKPSENYAKSDPLILSGVSGGGSWKANLRKDGTSCENWNEKNLKMIGVHIGSQDNDKIDHQFARQILIGHHLALIAREIKSLSTKIYDQWPILNNKQIWQV